MAFRPKGGVQKNFQEESIYALVRIAGGGRAGRPWWGEQRVVPRMLTRPRASARPSPAQLEQGPISAPKERIPSQAAATGMPRPVLRMHQDSSQARP